MFGVADGFQDLLAAHLRVDDTVNAAGAGGGAVFEPELKRVDIQLGSQQFDHVFGSETRLRRTRCAIGEAARFVEHDVVTVDEAVGNFVTGEYTHRGCADETAWIGAGLKDDIGVGGDDLAVFVGAHLDLDIGTGCRAGALEDGGAGHDQLDGLAAGFGEHGGYGLEVDRDLAAESAADFLWYDFDLGDWHVEDRAGLCPGGERTLGAGPDGDLAVGVPHRGGVVRLDISLMYGCGAELALDDHVGRSEGGVGVAELVLEMRGKIARAAGVLAELLGGHVRMELRRSLLHGLAHVENCL